MSGQNQNHGSGSAELSGAKAQDVLGMLRAISDIVTEILRRRELGKKIDVLKIKNAAAARHGLSSTPKMVDIIAALPEEHRQSLSGILTAKPIRSASGISVIAVMCKPHRCPHVQLTGNVCLYCAGGPDSDFEYSTQAYTGYEPTCLTVDHEILTKYAGWKGIKDIRVGEDQVLTINPVNLSMEWQEVQERFEYDYFGDLYHLSSDEIDAVCTPNHRWLHINSNGKDSNPTFNTVEELLNQSQFRYHSKTFTNPSRLIPLSGMNNTLNHRWSLPFLSSSLTINEDLYWCKFIGAMLGAGNLLSDPLSESAEALLVLHEIPGERNLLSIISSMGIPFHTYTSREGVVSYEFYSYEMYQFFYPMFNGSNGRSLHYSWKYLLSATQARSIIEGWIASAGKWNGSSKFSCVGHTNSVSLKDDLTTLGALANSKVQFSTDASLPNQYSISFDFKTHTRSNICTAPLPCPSKLQSLPPFYDGKVYSMRVANRTYYTRRNPRSQDDKFSTVKHYFTGNSMRAIRARYDPYKQTHSRVEQLRRLGHTVDKVEFIIMGGTFMSLPVDYREEFIRNLHDALSGHTSTSLKESIAYSEQSATRCIGITIETRPDYCLAPHLSAMLNYGCTRLEIGVQSVYEDVARDTNRGHSVRAVTECFHLSKDAGYKIIAHMMPDLPNMGWERDIEQFREFFANPSFRADGLKIYPTLVIRGTGLYELWKSGKYTNYAPDQLIELLANVLALVPPWTRIYRIQRDIPMPLVSSGVEHGNLRELVLKRMKTMGLSCRDVRTREVGIRKIHSEGETPIHVELVRRDYSSNGGWETFLAYEDPRQDALIGLLRLRQCSPQSHRPELREANGKGCSIVRELHVYGSAVPVHSRDPTKFQHQGYGTLLMEEAENIARNEHGSRKLAVISGVGTRHYYRKLGYELDGPYMSKLL